MDKLTRDRRSENMRRITSKNTTPEMIVRKLIHGMGYRYRLHAAHLPGKPDLVFPGRKCVIFVHGCFWHQHSACREGRLPGTRPEYWVPKLTRNIERDRERIVDLRKLGWRVLVLWECQVEEGNTESKVKRFLR